MTREMIIELSPKTGSSSGLCSTRAQPQAMRENAGEATSPGVEEVLDFAERGDAAERDWAAPRPPPLLLDHNESLYPNWYMPPQVIQGKDVVTPAAGVRDRLVAEAERLAFDAIQATAAENSLSFWDNPEEDVYEDL